MKWRKAAVVLHTYRQKTVSCLETSWNNSLTNWLDPRNELCPVPQQTQSTVCGRRGLMSTSPHGETQSKVSSGHGGGVCPEARFRLSSESFKQTATQTHRVAAAVTAMELVFSRDRAFEGRGWLFGGRELINKRVPSLSTSASGFLDSHCAVLVNSGDWSLVRGRHRCLKAPPEAIIKLFSKKKKRQKLGDTMSCRCVPAEPTCQISSLLLISSCLFDPDMSEDRGLNSTRTHC